jgi:hypothetical protein
MIDMGAKTFYYPDSKLIELNKVVSSRKNNFLICSPCYIRVEKNDCFFGSVCPDVTNRGGMITSG